MCHKVGSRGSPTIPPALPPLPSVPKCHIHAGKSLQGWGLPPSLASPVKSWCLIWLWFVYPCCDVSIVSCDLPQLISGALIMLKLERKGPKFIWSLVLFHCHLLQASFVHWVRGCWGSCSAVGFLQWCCSEKPSFGFLTRVRCSALHCCLLTGKDIKNCTISRF